MKVVLKDGKLAFEFEEKAPDGGALVVEADAAAEVGEADAEEPVLA